MDPCGEGLGTVLEELAVEVVAVGGEDGDGERATSAALEQSLGGQGRGGVVVAGDDEAREAGGRVEGAEVGGGHGGCGREVRAGGA